MSQQNELFIWGTGSWGHCRKPTLITNICKFEENQFANDLILGDNYGLTIGRDKFHLIGTQKLPEYSSKF